MTFKMMCHSIGIPTFKVFNVPPTTKPLFGGRGGTPNYNICQKLHKAQQMLTVLLYYKIKVQRVQV